MKNTGRKTVKAKTTAPLAARATTVQAATAVEATAKPAPSSERIAARAFEIFLSRGGAHGQHLQDWLQAERELNQ